MITTLLLAAAVAAKTTPDFLPNAADSKIVSVAAHAAARAEIVVLTQAIAIKESGPKETVKTFGEVYAFDPAVFAVHREVPTRIEFWNLQGDDEHDVMLLDRGNHVVVQFKLPPLQKTSRVFTFHARGIYRFVCTLHQPEMSGAIVVE